MSGGREGTGALLVALALVPALALALPGSARAQDPATAVREVGNGQVSFILPVREEVEVCRNGIRTGPGRTQGWTWEGRPDVCTTGAGRVRLEVTEGVVRAVDFGPVEEVRAGDRDLGVLTPAAGADYLLDLAATAPRASVAEDALMPAALVRDVEIWPRLLELARNADRPRDVRRSALFWVGQAAGDEIAGELQTEVLEGEEVELRKAAVFSLSQMDGDRGVDALLDVARSPADPEVRRSAFFWLAQSDDPRAADFFEQVLRGGG